MTEEYAGFSAEVDRIQHERSGEIAAILADLRAGRDDATVDALLDDPLDDVRGDLCARSANQVADDDADDAVEGCSRLFTEDVSNAVQERRIAALLTAMSADDLRRAVAAETDHPVHA